MRGDRATGETSASPGYGKGGVPAVVRGAALTPGYTDPDYPLRRNQA
jgi:hypothetical protein